MAIGPSEALVQVGLMGWAVPVCWECGERMTVERLQGGLRFRDDGDGMAWFACYRIGQHRREAGVEVVHQVRFHRMLDGDSVEWSSVRVSDWALLAIGTLP